MTIIIVTSEISENDWLQSEPDDDSIATMVDISEEPGSSTEASPLCDNQATLEVNVESVNPITTPGISNMLVITCSNLSQTVILYTIWLEHIFVG